MKKGEIKKLDKLWGLAIRKRANDLCEKCGKPANNPHHIFGRKNFSVRWDLENGICLCSGCHTMNRWSAHQAPTWFSDWLKEKRGEEWYDNLLVRANRVAFNNFEDIKIYLEKGGF
jgi:hypothetical protein